MIPPVILELREDARGATIVEFALAVPVLMVFLLGGMDLGYTLYMRDILQGTVQKAARDSTIENAGAPATKAAIDQKVKDAVLQLAPSADVTFDRRAYKSFTEAAAQEAERVYRLDSNGNPVLEPAGTACSAGKYYIDTSGNNVWDRLGGTEGQGGAQDNVIYTVGITYDRLFPIHKLMPSIGPRATVTAITVLENQPYGDQAQNGPAIGKACA